MGNIDISKVPQRILYTGAAMPAIGMGTFGSDHADAQKVQEAVRGAIRVGYRHFDGAAGYGNEHQIGEVYAEAIHSGLVKREDLFIVSKVWNNKWDDAESACRQTLKDLQLDYLDLYYVHWPFPNYHAPGAGHDDRNENSVPFSVKRFMGIWRQMEHLVDIGLVRHIGMSNMTIPKLKAVLPLCRIKPACLENEIHPCFQQQDLFDFCQQNQIQLTGYCPLGSPQRPDRDRDAEDIADLQQPVIREIAKAHGVHPALIALKWAVQRGHTPIPFSENEAEYTSNIRCVTEDPLSEEEMAKMKTMECNNRLIKGQVFLWPDAKDWTDIWDLDGTDRTWEK